MAKPLFDKTWRDHFSKPSFGFIRPRFSQQSDFPKYYGRNINDDLRIFGFLKCRQNFWRKRRVFAVKILNQRMRIGDKH